MLLVDDTGHCYIISLSSILLDWICCALHCLKRKLLFLMASPGFVVWGHSLIHPLGVGQLTRIPGVREAHQEEKETMIVIHGDSYRCWFEGPVRIGTFYDFSLTDVVAVVACGNLLQVF